MGIKGSDANGRIVTAQAILYDTQCAEDAYEPWYEQQQAKQKAAEEAEIEAQKAIDEMNVIDTEDLEE